MTTGTIGSLTGFGYGPGGFYKTWSGSDGKTETVGGRMRDKWNNYTCVIQKQDNVKQSTTSPPRYISVTGEPSWSTLWKAYHEAELQGKLVSKVRGHDFNLAVNVAQGKQTVNMIVDNLGSLGRSFVALKRGDFSTAARQLGVSPRRSKLKTTDVSGRWLELQYGWLPMIGDTFEAVKAYAELHKNRSETVVVKKSINGTYNGSQSPTNWSGDGTWIYRKRIEYEMQESLSAARSLGLVDPLSVVWEVVPYSFVIDWFIPIGTFFDNLSVIPKLQGRFLTTTVNIYNNFGSSPPSNTYFRNATASYHKYSCTRTVTTGLSTAFPSFAPLPEAMSPRRIWNAISLAHQRFRFP